MISNALVLIVTQENENMRLDKFISSLDSVKSRTRAEYLINNNFVTVNSKIVKTSYKIKTNDHIEISLPQEKVSTGIRPYDLKLNIVFEDTDLIVINKPTGLVIHPAAGHHDDTLVNALVKHTNELSMKFGEDRPGIVHRLDKETSGLIVVAKNDITHEALALQFKNRSINRKYEAVAIGSLKSDTGTVSSYLARHPTSRQKYASIKDSKGKIIIPNSNNIPSFGKRAVTHFQLISTNKLLSLISLKLETGRTHQIRVHLSELGHSILNDDVYGGCHYNFTNSPQIQREAKDFQRFFLHAKILGFVHPRTQKNMLFEVDWPEKERIFIQKWIINKS